MSFFTMEVDLKMRREVFFFIWNESCHKFLCSSYKLIHDIQEITSEESQGQSTSNIGM